MRDDRYSRTARRVLLVSLMLGLSIAAISPEAPASAGQSDPVAQPEVPGASDLPDGVWVVTTAALSVERGDHVW